MDSEGYNIGRMFLDSVKSSPSDTMTGFAEAVISLAERPTVEEYKAAVKKAEERGAAREREKFISVISDIVPNLQWLESESQRHYVSGKAMKPQVAVMLERINFERHVVDVKGAEYDPSTMEVVKKVSSLPDIANKVCEAYSDAYITIFDGVVIEKIPVSVFAVGASQ